MFGVILVSKGIAPGSRRIHCDVPNELYDMVKAAADVEPAVSVAEYVRRMLAWRVNFPLPPATERKERNLRLTGEPKNRPGRKPKYALQGHIADSSVRAFVSHEALDDEIARFEGEGGV